ncbi:hypothetical protein IPL85_05255 [Candidatus Saccharibacteria bacterium]|nr:MAG: hypothetical protein IPL85_05255 [Candidatus Saccharibacteria bacterium]
MSKENSGGTPNLSGEATKGQPGKGLADAGTPSSLLRGIDAAKRVATNVANAVISGTPGIPLWGGQGSDPTKQLPPTQLNSPEQK